MARKQSQVTDARMKYYHQGSFTCQEPGFDMVFEVKAVEKETPNGIFFPGRALLSVQAWAELWKDEGFLPPANMTFKTVEKVASRTGPAGSQVSYQARLRWRDADQVTEIS